MDLDFEEPAPNPVDRFLLEIEGQADPSILFTGRDAFEGMTDQERTAAVQRMLHHMRVAKAMLDPASIQKGARELDYLSTVATLAAGSVLAELARVYARRVETEVTDGDFAPYDIPDPDATLPTS